MRAVQGRLILLVFDRIHAAVDRQWSTVVAHHSLIVALVAGVARSLVEARAAARLAAIFVDWRRQRVVRRLLVLRRALALVVGVVVAEDVLRLRAATLVEIDLIVDELEVGLIGVDLRLTIELIGLWRRRLINLWRRRLEVVKLGVCHRVLLLVEVLHQVLVALGLRRRLLHHEVPESSLAIVVVGAEVRLGDVLLALSEQNVAQRPLLR